MRNTQGKSYWIKEAFKNYDGEDLIITDVRRDSEVNFIKLLKLSLSRVFFYYIDRHVEDNDGLTLLSIKESRSLIDGIIDNNGNLKQLKENVKQVSRQIERRARRKSENRAGSKATVLDVLREL